MSFGIDNVSLIKTRCRASRRGEVFSPVGVRLPNPYENVHLCLEFAIYQTHVIDRMFYLFLPPKPLKQGESVEKYTHELAKVGLYRAYVTIERRINGIA